MNVGELFLQLGLAVDDEKFNAGTAAIKKLQNELKRVSLNALTARQNTGKALKMIGLSPPARAANKTLKELFAGGNRVSSTFARMASAAAAFFAVSKVKGMVSDVIELGGKLDDTAQKTGLSRKALQEFGFAAVQNGSSVEEFAGAVTKLSKGLVESAKTGKGPVSEAFRSMGISMRDPAVKSKNLEQILYLVASRFETMPDGAEKTALAMKLFGKSGADLIPTLNKGVRGLAELRTKANDLGFVLSDKTISDLDSFGDQIDEAKAGLQALRNQGVAALLPLLKELLTRFQTWVSTNQELIRTTIADVVYALAEALKLLGTILIFVIEHWKIFAAVIGSLVVIKTVTALVAALVFLKSVFIAVGIAAKAAWLSALGPVGLIVAAIALLGVVLYKYRDKVKAVLFAVGRFFKNLWTSIKTGVVSTFNEVVGFVTGYIDDIKQVFIDVGNAIMKIFTDAFNFVANKAKATVNAIRNAPVIKQVVDFVGGEQPTGPSFTDTVLGAAAGARSAAASASVFPSPSRGVPSGRSPSVNQNSNYAITVNAANADAKEVSKMVADRLREYDERVRRETFANLGIKP